jgi:transaldolase
MGINASHRRAVFVDRDGVINRAVVRDGRPHPPASVEDVELLPGVEAGLERLKAAGYLLIVVTNQPDVARGVQSRAIVDAIHARLAGALPIDEFRTCYHDDKDACECRKPKPGLILAAARERHVDLAASVMIGDRWRDIEAGRSAGCATVFVDCGYAERKPDAPDAVVASFEEAARWVLSRDGDETVKPVDQLSVKIFADGADLAAMLDMYRKPYIKGFTTNPTLMNRAGIRDYRAFARQVLDAIPDRPISFEVFSDDFAEMERQAHEIAGWAANVYVKIPVTNTVREPAYDLVHTLSHAGVKVNVTALMTLSQVRQVVDAVSGGAPSCISVFAGRIADTGRDPVPLMAEAAALVRMAPRAELIWASPREVLNVYQADAIGCHIITVTNDILKKLAGIGKDLSDYSLDTVKMFYDDGVRAGFLL